MRKKDKIVLNLPPRLVAVPTGKGYSASTPDFLSNHFFIVKRRCVGANMLFRTDFASLPFSSLFFPPLPSSLGQMKVCIAPGNRRF
jgi:hypothetical protein